MSDRLSLGIILKQHWFTIRNGQAKPELGAISTSVDTAWAMWAGFVKRSSPLLLKILTFSVG
jgi:hypothetical protein